MSQNESPHVNAENGNLEQEENRGGPTNPIAGEVDRGRDSIGSVLDPILTRKQKKLQQLSQKKESKEVSPFDFDLNFIFQLNEAGLPLTKKDMLHETGGQALVLTRADFDVLGIVDFISATGERMIIESDSLHENDVFILYPYEVGDEEKE